MTVPWQTPPDPLLGTLAEVGEVWRLRVVRWICGLGFRGFGGLGFRV